MRKRIALLLTIVLMFSVLAPCSTAFAARNTDVFTGGTMTGDCKIENGVLTMRDTATYYKVMPVTDSYTAEFTARFEKFGTGSNTFTVFNGKTRAAFYVKKDRLTVVREGTHVYYTFDDNWHDFRLEVTNNENISLYIDNQLMSSSLVTTKNLTGGRISFATGEGTIAHFSDFSITSHTKGPLATTGSITAMSETIDIGDDYTPAFVTDWSVSKEGWDVPEMDGVIWNKEKGVITLDSSLNKNSQLLIVQRPMNFTTNFDWEWEMQIESNENGKPQFKYGGDGYNSYFYIEENLLRNARVAPKYKSNEAYGIPVEIGKEWHTWKMERRGAFLTLYIDGGKIATYETYPSTIAGVLWYNIQAGATGRDCIHIGKIKYTPYYPTLAMQKPYQYSEYAEGTDVVIQAKAESETDYIDYYVNDVEIGRGYAPDYKYVLKNANVGSYRISAGVGDSRSVPHAMIVKPAFDIKLQIADNEIEYGKNASISVKTEAFSKDVEPTKVEYFVNGKVVATATQAPFKATIKDLEVGTTAIYAKATNKNNISVTTDVEYINVYTDAKNAVKFNREYDISYKYDSGTGKLNVEDGYFKLAMEHNGTKIKYETIDGTKEYALNKIKDTIKGFGDFRVIVTSGSAEIYYNGHYAFSFFMPRTSAKNKVTYSGVKDFKMNGRNNKAVTFYEEWKGQADYKSDYIKVSENYSLEFDKTDLSDEVIEFFDGDYQHRITFKDGKVTVRNQGKVGGEQIDEALPLENPAAIGYYRLTVSRGVGQLWCDNKYIGSYVGPLYAHKPQLFRKMTNPSTSTIITIKGTDDIYYHSEDFSGNKELIAADYWYVDDKSDMKTQITGDGEQNFVKLEGTGKYILNAVTKNINWKSRVKVDSAKDFYILTRYFNLYYDTRFGYDFQKKCWYVVYDNYGGSDNPARGATERREFPAKFELGKWHDIEVITDEKLLTLIVDGKTIASFDDFWFVQAGTSGIGIVDGTAYVTNVEYAGRCKASPGLIMNDNSGSAYNDFFTINDGKTVVSAQKYSVHSIRMTEDNGKTWSKAVTNTELGQSFWGNVVNLDGGNTLMRVREDGSTPVAEVSEDYGVTWTRRAVISERPAARRLSLNGMFRQAKDGTLIYTTDESAGSETSSINGIYFSNDNGYTWWESDSTPLYSETIGKFTQEINVIDMPEEGHIRFYGRSDHGFIQTMDSYDGGKTFEVEKLHNSNFPAATCTFSIRRDLYEDQTYYMLWTYDTETSWQNRYSCPRNRVALSVSYDGCKTWQFVQTLNDIGDYPYGLCRNNSMEIIEDTIYISWNGNGSLTGEGLLYAIDKNKIKPLSRFEEIHSRTYVGTRAYDEAHSLSVIPNESGEAWLVGNYEDVSVQAGNMIEPSALGKALSSDVVKSGNTVTFKLGDGVVKFTEGSSSYDVNGTVTDFGTACMKNGYINIEACAKAFGKLLTKFDGGWVLWFDAVYDDVLKKQVEGII